jgi:tetratricopeptide (TPR) repeat protein
LKKGLWRGQMKFFGNKKNDEEKGEKTIDDLITEGGNYYDNNRFDKAVECYNEVLKQDPDNVTAWGDKGKANYKLKNYQQALDDLNHALELDPEYIFGYYLRAFPLVQLKQYPEAIESFKIFQRNAGSEYKKEVENTQKNLENLLKYCVDELEVYKKLFPVKNTYDITSSDLEIEGRLKDRMVKIYGQNDGLRFSDVDFLDKIKENLFFIEYPQIDSIDFEKSMLAGKILLNAEGTEIIINCFSSRDGRSFVDRVHERVIQFKPQLKPKSVKMEGFHRKTRSEVEILILDEGLSLKNKEDESSEHGQVFYYEDIENVQFNEGLINVQEGVLKGELSINLRDKSQIEINKVTNPDGRYIEDVVQEKLFKVNSITREKLKSISNEPGMIKQQQDPLDEIEKAKKLLDMGAITEEQFEEIRDRCLKKLS